MLRSIFMGLVMLPVSALAQEFKDDTADIMPAKTKESFSNALLAKTSDPFSTQVIRVRKASAGDESYCGMMNAKNLNGAYTGFTSFKFIAKTEKLYVDVACE